MLGLTGRAELSDSLPHGGWVPCRLGEAGLFWASLVRKLVLTHSQPHAEYRSVHSHVPGEFARTGCEGRCSRTWTGLGRALGTPQFLTGHLSAGS